MMNELFYNIANGMMIDFSANQSTLHYFIMMHFTCTDFDSLLLLAMLQRIFLCYYLSAMVKVGDNHWYGKTVPQNITFAAEMYAEAASKNNLPQVTLVSSPKTTRRLSEF